MEISYQYTKPRREFGRHVKLTDGSAEMLADIRPNEEHEKKYVDRRVVSTVLQVLPEMSEHEAQTNPVVLANKLVNHMEGGWPKEVDFADAEHTIRYRKKVEKDGAYIKAVQAMGAVADAIVKSNNTLDLYEEYFDRLPVEQALEPPRVKTIAVLRDPASAKSRRTAQSLSWHPDGSRKLAVALCIMQFQAQEDSSNLSSYVWDMNNPNVPDAELKPLSSLTCLNYNMKDFNLIGGGQYNGQISYYDVRKGSAAVDVSQLEHSHKDPVYGFAWLQSKTGTECMSAASDGRVLWWDVRRLAEPVETLQLAERGSERPLGAVSLDYSPTAGPTKFVVGTEQGLVLAGNRKAKTPADRVGTSYAGHHGAVYAVARSPFFPKFFLTAGDWTARLWNEDLKTPIISSKYSRVNLTCARWSPTRPGVFFTTRSDGRVDVWDLFAKQHEPTLTLRVSDSSLASIRLQENGRICAVGCSDGSTSVLSLSGGLVDAHLNERHAVNLMFDRETSREKSLEKTAKEAKVKARREAATNAEAADKSLTEDELVQIERQFRAATGLDPI